MNLGGAELLIVLAVVALLFGAGWVPKAARNLGRAKVELDKTQRQIADTKRQVVEATGIEQLDATIRKTNRVLNSTPKGLLQSAATSALTTRKPAESASIDGEQIEDAEIVIPAEPDGVEDAAQGVEDAAQTASRSDADYSDNLNVDFSAE